jgi:LuxR family transcriptional regulator, maltose regulon positive regulatory protein
MPLEVLDARRRLGNRTRVTAVGPKPTPLPSWHVPRPRLVRLIEQHDVPVLLLRAPAGYGKSVAAREWAATRNRAIFFGATEHGADVVAFASGVLEAIGRVRAAGAEQAQSEAARLGIRDASPDELAQTLLAEIGSCGEDAVLILDDYHHLADSPAIESVVSALIEQGSSRLLVTTRTLPSWATPRRLIENVVAEIGASALTMTPSEAAAVLRGHSRSRIRSFWREAGGWPALVGLAAVAQSLDLPSGRMRRTLYGYFAEEVLRKEAPEVQDVIMRAAVPLAVRQSTVEAVLGVAVTPTLGRLVDDGLLHEEDDGSLKFHSLLREFLRERLHLSEPSIFATLVAQAIALARRESRWEEAFELARSANDREAMVEVVADAAADLAEKSHREQLDRWVRACGPPKPRETGLRVAQLRVLAEQERYEDVARLAPLLLDQVKRRDPAAASVVWTLLGNSFHFRSMHRDALDAYLQGCDTAATDDDLRRSLWCAISAAQAIEDRAALEVLLPRMAALPSDGFDNRLLLASAQSLAAPVTHETAGLWNLIEPLLADADKASYMARVRLANAAGAVANARADYDVAYRIVDEARSFQRELGVANSFGLIRLAMAELGLRRFEAARRTIAEIEDSCRDNVMVDDEVVTLRAKLMLFEHGPESMLASMGQIRGTLRPAWGEYHGLRALALAALGDRDSASREIERANQSSVALDVHLLTRFAALICRISGEASADEAREEAIDALMEAHAAEYLDPFVIAYRAFPPLLRTYALEASTNELTAAVVGRANDHLLCDAYAPSSVTDALTPREREVLSLIADGRSNQEISERLVISRHTTKVHVHHILEKLGVHDRISAMRIARSYDTAR